MAAFALVVDAGRFAPAPPIGGTEAGSPKPPPARKDYVRIKAGRAYFGEFDPFGDFDLLFGAVRQNLRILEIPVRYRERTYGVTNISRFHHGWLLMKMVCFGFVKLKW